MPTTKPSKNRAILLPGLLLAAILGGCLADKAVTDDGPALLEGDTEVRLIVPPHGSQPGIIVTRNFDYECQGATLRTNISDDTARYVISGGKLYLWQEGSCLVDMVLTGSSHTITGKWTAASLAVTDSVPAAYRSEDCGSYGGYDYGYDYGYDQEDGAPYAEIFENASGTYTITSTNIHTRITGTFCFAPVFAAGFAIGGDSAYGVTVTSSTCSSVTLHNAESEKSATITVGIQGGVATASFASGDSVCSFPDISLSNAPPVCSASSGGESDLFGCLVGSGFYGDLGAFEKRAAGSVENRLNAALKRALPFARRR